jgi:flagellin-like protein
MLGGEYEKMKNENKASKIRVGKDRRKKGVSPVIGVILMVAATIVIAAVVLAMLGGFTAPRTQYMVTATASTDALGTTAYVTYHGGPDAAQVDGLTASINGITDQLWLPLAPAGVGWGAAEPDTVVAAVGTGGSCDATTCAVGPGADNDHVIVTATFLDGSSQVILDTYV